MSTHIERELDSPQPQPAQTASDASTSLAENRRASRRRILKAGKIFVGTRAGGAIDCSILDMSDIGAKLRARAFNLPKAFRLLIVSEGVIVPVNQIWQRGELIGVEFAGEKRRAPPLKF